MITIAERVAAGAAWLDEHEPGWVERINVDTLDIRMACGCILGQLYGDYFRSPEDARRAATKRGFRSTGQFAFEQYADLTDEWRELILARRALAVEVKVS